MLLCSNHLINYKSYGCCRPGSMMSPKIYISLKKHFASLIENDHTFILMAVIFLSVSLGKQFVTRHKYIPIWFSAFWESFLALIIQNAEGAWMEMFLVSGNWGNDMHNFWAKSWAIVWSALFLFLWPQNWHCPRWRLFHWPGTWKWQEQSHSQALGDKSPELGIKPCLHEPLRFKGCGVTMAWLSLGWRTLLLK